MSQHLTWYHDRHSDYSPYHIRQLYYAIHYWHLYFLFNCWLQELSHLLRVAQFFLPIMVEISVFCEEKQYKYVLSISMYCNCWACDQLNFRLVCKISSNVVSYNAYLLNIGNFSNAAACCIGVHTSATFNELVMYLNAACAWGNYSCQTYVIWWFAVFFLFRIVLEQVVDSCFPRSQWSSTDYNNFLNCDLWINAYNFITVY